jgi:hypothetical protein
MHHALLPVVGKTKEGVKMKSIVTVLQRSVAKKGSEG